MQNSTAIKNPAPELPDIDKDDNESSDKQENKKAGRDHPKIIVTFVLVAAILISILLLLMAVLYKIKSKD